MTRLCEVDGSLLTESHIFSVYCMFLNTQGRVLFDALIYHGGGGDHSEVFLLDIDQKCSNLAKKHLSMYKIRRKVAIDIDSQYSVFGVFNKDCQVSGEDLSEQSSEALQGDDGVLIFPDPRLSSLGNRILIDEDRVGQISSHLPSHTKLCSTQDFIQYRCLLGVAEGPGEIPMGKSTPLEYNLGKLPPLSGPAVLQSCTLTDMLECFICHPLTVLSSQAALSGATSDRLFARSQLSQGLLPGPGTDGPDPPHWHYQEENSSSPSG